MCSRTLLAIGLLFGLSTAAWGSPVCPPGEPSTLLFSPASQTTPPDQDLGLFEAGAARGPSASRAICIATCSSGSTVSCSYTPPATCVAVDSSCPSQRGYVSCNGVTTYCPVCGAVCNEGTYFFSPLGECCAARREYNDKYQCINGQWQWVGTTCRPTSICPIIP